MSPRKSKTVVADGPPAPAASNEKTGSAEVVIRDAIKTMSGFKDEDALAKAIPESTAEGNPEKKRKRRTKAEMEAAKGSSLSPEIENDARYKKAVTNMSAFGGAKTVRSAFAVTGAPLQADENEEVEDYFYVISKRYSLDASRSGIFLSVYAILLMLRLICTRLLGTTSASLWSQFEGMFKKETTEPETAEAVAKE